MKTSKLSLIQNGHINPASTSEVNLFKNHSFFFFKIPDILIPMMQSFSDSTLPEQQLSFVFQTAFFLMQEIKNANTPR